MNRIEKHMILEIPERKKIDFFFENKKLSAFEDEIISSALFANGIKTFSEHHKDKKPQGIFCANGQCSQCTVLADGVPVKACITRIKPRMKIKVLKGFPNLPVLQSPPEPWGVEELEIEVLVLGGGPSGLSAAIELGKLDVPCLVIDDKHKLGGKLILQTHKFFGTVEDCFAGTRGIDIAEKLQKQLKEYSSIKVWLNAVCIGIFSDKKAGIVYDGKYFLVKPKAIIIATGAREKFLAFPGNTLPGIYGAGAFQTLANRDLIRPAKRLFIIGGGNVGLIAAYHALQSEIEVVGLAEAMPEVGGYKVHADKIKRLGVPIYTSHTVLSANGKTEIESVTIIQIDENFNHIKGTEKTFKVDTLLIATGLNPVQEFYTQAKEFGMNAFVCGDAHEIAEASAAMFSGKITAHKVLKSLGIMVAEVPQFWYEKLEILKSRPGRIHPPGHPSDRLKNPVYPVFFCRQEIPCDPCVTVCPKKSIKLISESVMAIPVFEGECIGCFKCLFVCPGLAVTMVDFRKDKNAPIVSVPFEISRGKINKGDIVRVTNEEGSVLANAEVVSVRDFQAENIVIVSVKTKPDIADKIAGIRLYDSDKPENFQDNIQNTDDSTIVCLCERVTLGEIKKAIRSGIKDLNQLKAVTRFGMGACGSKTCSSIILSILKNEGIDLKEVTPLTQRPPFMEVSLGQFCNAGIKEDKKEMQWSDF